MGSSSLGSSTWHIPTCTVAHGHCTTTTTTQYVRRVLPKYFYSWDAGTVTDRYLFDERKVAQRLQCHNATTQCRIAAAIRYFWNTINAYVKDWIHHNFMMPNNGILFWCWYFATNEFMMLSTNVVRQKQDIYMEFNNPWNISYDTDTERTWFAVIHVKFTNFRL